ncbi:hypothetical protein Hypma_013258 [Hypsizygus marmoreus]|uniref:Amine oxidase domain-containing protein n=1 Tax=Hypsizygus marmoreus TaxID=39966 RepID=A0A369JEF8_HYPMA|nr:hypothetical protein Hypma_013258 [Hypsizygus marmoreus]
MAFASLVSRIVVELAASFVCPHHDNLRSNVERLYFAGETTSQEYSGESFFFKGLSPRTRFLHGAYFEGVNVAQEMVKCIRQHGCMGLRHVSEVGNLVPYGG